MTTKELENALKEKGFTEDRLDSGCNYIRTSGHIELICYVEPDIEVEFISIYRWKNNDVKGTYNIDVKELANSDDSIASFFRKTKNNLPQFIGETIDTHTELEKSIKEIV